MKMTAETNASVNTTSLLGELFLFEGHAVRVVGSADDPLFIAADVCEALGIAKYRDALAAVPDWARGVSTKMDTLGGAQGLATVTEAGLYLLSFRSRKIEGERFQKWVCAEVLPQLRKHGFYAREGMDGRLARIERAKGLRARKQALLAETKALATEIARLEDLGSDAASVAEVLGTAHAPLAAINRCLAFARRNAVPVGRRDGHTILPRAAIIAALGLDQSNLPLN